MESDEIERVTEELVDAIASLSRQKIGALMVFENTTGLNEIVETGTTLNADISAGLIINIFIPNTPLHDGAVIIKGSKIRAAGCFLPLTDNSSLSRSFWVQDIGQLLESRKNQTL